MTALTFYGGVNEIGGNKILIEDSGTKIFLDFGMSFGTANCYFSVSPTSKMQWTWRFALKTISQFEKESIVQGCLSRLIRSI